MFGMTARYTLMACLDGPDPQDKNLRYQCPGEGPRNGGNCSLSLCIFGPKADAKPHLHPEPNRGHA
jgi:hypothetical protein